MTPTVPGTKCSREGDLGVGEGFFVCLGGAVCFSFITMDKTFSPDSTEDLQDFLGLLLPLLPLSTATAPTPVTRRLWEKACSYNTAWLEGLATPTLQFQRAGSWKEGRTVRGAGMLRRDINSTFLSGFRSSHLFSFPLFTPGRVRREPALQRGNFLEGLVI